MARAWIEMFSSSGRFVLMRVLIGSKALQKYQGFENRKNKDIDYFSDEKIENAETFFHPDILQYFGDVNRAASLDELYTIKISHIFWDINWDKHIYDILNMQDMEAQLIEELYNVLYKIWEEKYGKKKANLNVMASEFFTEKVTRIYDHDSIHASVAYYDSPLFNKILVDGEEVKVDRNKFEALSLEDKLKLVREEVYATALERILIPSEYKESPRKAYKWALKQTIISFSKGWFPLFIILNITDLWLPDVDFVKRHKDNKSKLIKLEA